MTRREGAPGASAARQRTVTVTIQEIDPKTPSVTIKTADGRVLTFRVENPKNLEKVKVGDTVDVTYTQGLLLKADPAGQVSALERLSRSACMRLRVFPGARWSLALGFCLGLALMSATPAVAQQATSSKPNILVLFGDDIGFWNVSAYNHGMMGYQTPNIDRIAKEGALSRPVRSQSCTAGRAAFITGQSPIRTGLFKVGLPSAPEGLHAQIRRSPTC